MESTFRVRGLVGWLALVTVACGGHAATTREARTALDVGDPNEALRLLDERLEVDSPSEVPEDLDSSNVLYLLDRSMVLQELGKSKLSSHDLEVADKQLMVLDFSRGATDELGKYLFSDQSGPYRAPAYEKLLVNTMNMMNYLSRGDLEGARVEARRLSVLEQYFKNSGEAKDAFIGPGSYLAGFVFEKSGQPDEALRYYDEALQAGKFQSLSDPIRRLAAVSSYRTPRISALLADTAATDASSSASPALPADGTSVAGSPDFAEIVTIINYGRVPPKVAERIPIGLALTYASGALSPNDQARANRLAAQGLVTWVNYPRLGKPRGQWESPSAAIDGQWQPLDGALAVDREAKKAWDAVRGAVVASAITRTIARIVAGEVVRKSTNDGALGLLLSLGTQATLTALDTPDTRSWSMLPARIAIGRTRVRPGVHWVYTNVRGQRLKRKITLGPRQWIVIVDTVLR